MVVNLNVIIMIAPHLVSHSIMCSLIDSRRTMYSLEMAKIKKMVLNVLQNVV